MKASELRIGNFVEARTPSGWITTTVDIDMIGGIVILDNETDLVMGIPITPEWLERLGFEKKGTNEGFVMRFGPIDFPIINDVIYPPLLILQGYDFKYVHQLQNIYHALTGQELTVKEK